MVEDGLEHIAMVFESSIELTDVNSLAAAKLRATDGETNGHATLPASAPISAVPPEAPAEPPSVAAEPPPPEPVAVVEHVEPLPAAPLVGLGPPADPPRPPAEAPAPEPAAVVEQVEPLPAAPLLGLEPPTVTELATPEERAQALDLQLKLIGALANVSIATAWDEGRIIQAAPDRPPCPRSSVAYCASRAACVVAIGKPN